MKKLLLFVMALSFGCAHGPRPTIIGYEKMLSSWVGTDSEKLVRAWGLPNQTMDLPSGSKGMAYNHNGGSFTEGHREFKAYVVNTVHFSCTTTFFVGKNNKIDSWRHEGNSCVASDPDEVAQYKAEQERMARADKDRALAQSKNPFQ